MRKQESRVQPHVRQNLHIVHAVSSDAFAGVERHIAVLARAQANRGHRITVIGGDSAAMQEALRTTAVVFVPGSTVFGVTKALRRLAGRCDIIHVHMTATEFAAAITALGPTRGIPVVTTRHFAAHRGQSFLGGLAADFIASRMSAQIAISQYVADTIDGASTVVHPGVERSRLPDVPREQIVLVVQRLEREKRTDIAITAFAEAHLAERGWRLRIAGDGSLRGDLERQVRALGISHAVDFLGRRSDVPELMARSAVLLAPCPIEGLGLSVLEAMAARLPVIASAAGGHLETLPTQAHRFCFPQNDAGSAAAALVHLAADADLREALAAAGLSRQQARFTPTAQATATDTVYRSVFAESGT